MLRHDELREPILQKQLDESMVYLRNLLVTDERALLLTNSKICVFNKRELILLQPIYLLLKSYENKPKKSTMIYPD